MSWAEFALVQIMKGAAAGVNRWGPEILARLRRPRDRWIGLIELRNFAATKGWNFKGEPLQLLDFMNALTEAGRLGSLTFIGRRYERLSERFLYAQGRVEIPKAEWANMEIGPAGITDIDSKDNAVTRLRLRNPIGKEAYADIYVHRRLGKLWLRNEASLVKGRTAAKEAAWQKARGTRI